MESAMKAPVRTTLIVRVLSDGLSVLAEVPSEADVEKKLMDLVNPNIGGYVPPSGPFYVINCHKYE